MQNSKSFWINLDLSFADLLSMVPLVYILSLLEFSSKNRLCPNKQEKNLKHYLHSITDQEQVF